MDLLLRESAFRNRSPHFFSSLVCSSFLLVLISVLLDRIPSLLLANRGAVCSLSGGFSMRSEDCLRTVISVSSSPLPDLTARHPSQLHCRVNCLPFSPSFSPNLVVVCSISGERFAAPRFSAAAAFCLSQHHTGNQNPRVSIVNLMGLAQSVNSVGLCLLSAYSSPSRANRIRSSPARLSPSTSIPIPDIYFDDSRFRVHSIYVLLFHYNLILFIIERFFSRHIVSEGFLTAKYTIVALHYVYRSCEGFLPRSRLAMFSFLWKGPFAHSCYSKEGINANSSIAYLACGLNESEVIVGFVLMTILGDKNWFSTSRYTVTKLLCSGVTVRPFLTHSNIGSNLLSCCLSICFVLFVSLICCICLRGCLIPSMYSEI